MQARFWPPPTRLEADLRRIDSSARERADSPCCTFDDRARGGRETMRGHVRSNRHRVWGFALAAVLVTQFVPVASRAAASGSIAGSVESGGSAVRDICVDVFSASGTLVLQTVTDANGMYAANDLPAGPYKVHFDDCVGPDDYAPEWNGGGRDQSLAPIVTVTVGTTTQVNADLDRLGGHHRCCRRHRGLRDPRHLCAGVRPTRTRGRVVANGCEWDVHAEDPIPPRDGKLQGALQGLRRPVRVRSGVERRSTPPAARAMGNRDAGR